MREAGWVVTLPATPRHITNCYRCSLPGLAGFTGRHCEGTDRITITTCSKTANLQEARIIRSLYRLCKPLYYLSQTAYKFSPTC
jgi:hypothetical protein